MTGAGSSAGPSRNHPAVLRARVALATYTLAALCLVTGTALAARAYPQGFDWVYSVMSSLASLKHNPRGARWFSLALALAMVLLWPLTVALRSDGPMQRRLARFSVGALRFGLVFGMLMGLERAVFFHASSVVDKSHEVLALLCFGGLYLGAMSQCLLRMQISKPARRWLPALLLAQLLIVGLVQLILYLTQRELGWVGRDWRALGIAPWQSFAFWQWLAGGALLVALGCFAAEPAAGAGSAASGKLSVGARR